MPRFTWSPEAIADTCRRLAAGQHYDDIADAHGVSRNAVTGLIYRLRFHKDDRLPEDHRVANPARFASQRRQRRSRSMVLGPSITTVAALPPIDDRERDRLQRIAALQGSKNLLRAQLRAGQHLLDTPLACALAKTIGLNPAEVRPA